MLYLTIRLPLFLLACVWSCSLASETKLPVSWAGMPSPSKQTVVWGEMDSFGVIRSDLPSRVLMVAGLDSNASIKLMFTW